MSKTHRGETQLFIGYNVLTNRRYRLDGRIEEQENAMIGSKNIPFRVFALKTKHDFDILFYDSFESKLNMTPN